MPDDIRSQLIPTLRRGVLAERELIDAWGERLVAECRGGLAAVLPLEEAELEVLDLLLDHGELAPALLTSDPELAGRIRSHPALEWKALNVRQFKG